MGIWLLDRPVRLCRVDLLLHFWLPGYSLEGSYVVFHLRCFTTWSGGTGVSVEGFSASRKQSRFNPGPREVGSAFQRSTSGVEALFHCAFLCFAEAWF